MLVMVFILILPLAINIINSIYIIIVISPLICSLRNHMNEPKYVRYVMFPLFQHQLKGANEELEERRNDLANLEHRYVYRCVAISVAEIPHSSMSRLIHV